MESERRKIQQTRRRRVRTVMDRLDARYGGEAWDKTRIPRDPLDDLVRTVLSQNTTDDNRDRAYDTMRARYPSWESVMAARPDALKKAIAVAGLANSKGPAIQRFLKWLDREYGALTLDFLRDLTEDEGIALLTQHKGIGLKTAYIVLSFSCGKDLCAVDTHVHRILMRLDLIDETCGREKAHTELRPMIPGGRARAFHANMIDFGKDVCTARSPTCGDCPLARLCRFRAANDE